MSKSKQFSVRGKAKWAKVFEHNRDRHEMFEETDGIYTLDLYLEQDELNTVSESRSRVKPKIDEDGVFVKFRRPHQHKAGIEALGGPPAVVDAEGKPWKEDTYIGNGSDVEVWFTVYDSKFGTGTRLDAIKVHELVEFDTEEREDKPLPWEAAS